MAGGREGGEASRRLYGWVGGSSGGLQLTRAQPGRQRRDSEGGGYAAPLKPGQADTPTAAARASHLRTRGGGADG